MFEFDLYDFSSYMYICALLLDCYLFNAQNVYVLTMLYIATLLIGALFHDKENQLQEISFKCLSALYISLFIVSLVLLRELDYAGGYMEGGRMLATIFLGIWFLDTFAYFGGKSLGRHKLWPRISPKKTVEGSISGIIGVCVAVFGSRAVFYPDLQIVDAVMLTLIIGIAGQLGDLIESFFKRKTGIKDSSSILPGHGGVLDRFDSLIFISPFAYYYVKWMVVLA